MSADTIVVVSEKEDDRMPLIEVKLYDRRVPDEASTKRIIEEMTEGLVRATGDEGVREHTWVVVQGVAPTSWGIAGKPGS